MRLSRHVGSWLARDLRIELHITPCVVMHPPPQCEALLNPANEQLVGTRFTPAECVRNLRGARDDAIIYPPQVVDGLVHELGGAALAEALAALPADARGHRCEAGAAVATDAFGELRAAGFSHIIHAVAPHFEPTCTDAHSTSLLERAYGAALRVAERRSAANVAAPLLGAGARGTPLDEAARAAARALANWRAAEPSLTPRRLAFGVQHDFAAAALEAALGAEPALEPG